MSQFQNYYPVFEGNQVLTSDQLNELVAYLDEQNRITRAKLIGMGIVCGLEVKPGTAVPLTIDITKGMGITSQGYLMALCDTTVNRYKPYTLPDGVNYAPFQNPQTKVQDVTLYEMVTPDYEPVTGETLTPLSSPAGFLDDKVVLLFMEIGDTDLKSCLGMSCNERGKVREFVIRKLLVSKADMEGKIFPRTCQQTGLFPGKYDLPEIIIRKVLFDHTKTNSKDYFNFSQNYINAIKGDQFVSNFATSSTGLYNKLFDALKQTYTDFAAILAPVYNGVNPFAAYPHASWTSYLNGSSSGPRYLGIQYFYDFIKDLILAYNEFRDSAFELMSECCMNMDCFPQHLMLGEAIPVESDQPSRYRHGFMLSPAFGNQNELLKKSIMLFNRMVLMVRKFRLDRINNPSITPVPPSTLGQPVLITPSKEKQGPLSQRSIPYYYNVEEADAELGTLEESWNFEYIKKYLFSKGLQPLSYGNQSTNQLLDQGPVKTPLYYDTDQYNFMRVEGGIRQSYVAVKDEIKKLQNLFDVSFNVVTLRLAGEPLDDIAHRCNFNDLRTEYGTLRLDILEMLKQVFDRFGVAGGRSINLKPFPAFINELRADTNSGGLFGSVTQPLIGYAIPRAMLEAEITGEEMVDTTRGDSSARMMVLPDEMGLERDSGTRDGGALEPMPPIEPGIIDGGTRARAFTIPVYAPQRTMSQTISYLNGSLTQMLQSIHEIISRDMIPFDLAAFNFGYTGQVPNSTAGFIQTYLSALQNAINTKVAFVQMLDLITRSTKTRLTAPMYFDLANYVQEVLGLLEKFITSTHYKSLTLLNYTYQYRFQYLKQNDQTLFSNFIQKHPGIEHWAGTRPGGTYVMVVPGNAVMVDPIKRDFMVTEIRDIKESEIKLARYQAQEYLSLEDQENMKVLRARVDSFVQIKDEVSIGVPIQKIAIQPTQVIADFWLPYLCCCDCECDVPQVTTAASLNIPAIAPPVYVEYNLGDYAFGDDMFVTQRTDGAIEINVVNTLQYQKSLYDPGQIKLYLINKNGVRIGYNVPRTTADVDYVDVTSMVTYNTPNDPANITAYGTVKIRVYNTGQAPTFIYNRSGSFKGIDSFYYMFEVLNDAGAVVSRSDMTAVNINVL